jgi:hypothetical protein
MSLQEMIDTLQTLRSNLCAALRRGEMGWLGMASDYQSSYAFSADYDKSFKHGYYDRATECREIAEQVATLKLPTTTTEIIQFVASAKKAAERCPQHPEVQAVIERLIAQMDSIALAASDPGIENSIEEDCSGNR